MSAQKRQASADEDESRHKSAKLTPPDKKRELACGPALSDRAYIKRIRMVNFLPYEDVVLEPGERLNLVVGPNGSGKSTLVCAICIALCGPLKVLDRGGAVRDYIRNGQEEGYVEIDLHQPKSSTGHVRIKRHITKSDNKSQFWINGVSKREKDVKELVAQMGIQLENLCQFLPQEKVQSFANYAGREAEFLKLVEQASNGELLKKHEKLEKMQTDVGADQKDLDDKKARLDEIQARKAQLEEEMKRQEELEEKKRKADIMERIIPHRRLRETKKELKDLKEKGEPLKTAFEDAVHKLEDLQEKERLAGLDLKQSSKEVSSLETEKHRIAEKCEQRKDEILKMESEVEDMRRQVDEHDKRLEKKETKKAKLAADVTELKAKKGKMGKEPPDLDARIKTASDRMMQLSKKVTNSHHEVDSAKKELRDVEGKKQAKQQEIKNFRSMDRIKQEAVHQSENKIWAAWRWFKDNADRFESEIFGPLCMEVSVQSKDAAAMVEGALGRDKLLFLVTNDRDYDTIAKIQRQSGQEHPIKVANVVKWTRTDVPESKVEGVSDAKLAEYYIDGTIIDRIQARREVMSFLANQLYFNRIPVGTRATAQKAEVLTGDSSLVYQQSNGKRAHRFTRVFTPEMTISINYSIYKNQRQSVSTQQLRNARVVIHGDDSRLHGIKQDLRQLEAEEVDVRQRLEGLERQDAAVRSEHQEAQQVKKDLTEEKAMYNTKQFDVMILNKEKELKDLADSIEKEKRKLPELKRKLASAHDKRFNEATKLKSLTDKITELFLKLLIEEAKIAPLRNHLKQCKDDVQAVREDVHDKEQTWKQEEVKIQKLQRKFDALKRETKEKVLTEEEKELFRPDPQTGPKMRVTDRKWDPEVSADEPPNWETADEFETALEVLEREIRDIGIVGDHGPEIQELGEEIENLESEIPELEARTRNHSRAVEHLKKEWLDGSGEEMGLRRMVELMHGYFSETMSRQNNVGQVELYEACEDGVDDFKKYGLRLKVKFREEQGLKVVNGSIQSGGETSLCVMLFILSMQQITKCPFRVVDEINQGLDKHYERAIFERIVEYSSQDDCSQCFVITPKLQGGMLNDVGQHITILNVFKGREMVSGAKKKGRF